MSAVPLHDEGRAATPVADGKRLVDPRQAVGGLALWYLEVRAGRRSVDQAGSWLDPALRLRLRAVAAHRREPPRVDPVMRVVAQRPSATRVEAVVLARRAERTTAVAVALEHRGVDGWRVVELSSVEERPPRLEVVASAPDSDEETRAAAE